MLKYICYKTLKGAYQNEKTEADQKRKTCSEKFL